MDHERIAAELWVERYIRGDLPAADAEAFEAHYVGCAKCLDQLETEERFGAGVKRAVAVDTRLVDPVADPVVADPLLVDAVTSDTEAAEAGVVDIAETRAARGGGLPARLAHRRRRGRLVLGLAALLLVALLPTGLLYRELRESRRELASAWLPRGSTHLLYLGPTRGEGPPVHRIRLGDPRTWTVLALELEAPAARYQVTLERDGAELWSASGLEPDSSDLLVLSLPMRALAPGDHQILVTPEGSGDLEPSPIAFRFRVLPATSE